MYQQIQIEGKPVFVPMLEWRAKMYQFNSASYFIRARFCSGHYPASSFYARLGELDFASIVRNLSLFYVKECRDHVFLFDAADSLEVLRLFVRLNQDCEGGWVQPLPDLEFVHPAAHALLYSLGGFSGGSADCYLQADPDAVDLNQKVR